MAQLDRYLVRLEEEVTARGGVVHWARDADGGQRDRHRARSGPPAPREVVKVKSMATQEIGLNEALAEAGIPAWETDLAELIVQLGDDHAVPHPRAGDPPQPGRDPRDLRPEMGGGRASTRGLTDDPAALAMAARLHLRQRFLAATVAVSGANFAVAETGTLAVVESEGNGRMCLTLPDTLITVMGIEKVVPTWRDLEVFLQLLPRSSTGERMNPYTSMWTGVTPGDGPRTFHLVLLDNGRTAVLADEVGRAALHCIRCSACLNVCPVYERTGGHAYGSVYPGPIGAVLTPHAHRRRGEPVPAVRLDPVRRLLRRLPGAHRHPDDAGPPAATGTSRPAAPVAGTGWHARRRVHDGVAATVRRRDPGGPVRPGARPPARPDPFAATAAVRLDRHPRRSAAADRDLPRLVAPHARGSAVTARDGGAGPDPVGARPAGCRWRSRRATTARPARTDRARRNCWSCSPTAWSTTGRPCTAATATSLARRSAPSWTVPARGRAGRAAGRLGAGRRDRRRRTRRPSNWTRSTPW